MWIVRLALRRRYTFVVMAILIALLPVHLHRVRARVAADRRGQVPLHAPGDGGRLRHAGLLSAVTHAGPHAGRVPARLRGRGVPTGGGGRPQEWGHLAPASRL